MDDTTLFIGQQYPVLEFNFDVRQHSGITAIDAVLLCWLARQLSIGRNKKKGVILT